MPSLSVFHNRLPLNDREFIKFRVLLSPRSYYSYACTTSVRNIIAIILLEDPRFQSIEPEFVEICKFPKSSKNMKREGSTSLVSKAGTISLTTYGRKGQSLVGTQTRPLVE